MGGYTVTIIFEKFTFMYLLINLSDYRALYGFKGDIPKYKKIKQHYDYKGDIPK